MLAYVTLGTNDLERAAKFYDHVLEPIGGKRVMEDEQFIAFGNSEHGCGLGISKPFDKQRATVGNGVMAAIEAPSREAVDAVYARALASGGTDEGAPGQPMPWFYAGYFRDLDGNKLNVCYMERGA